MLPQSYSLPAPPGPSTTCSASISAAEPKWCSCWVLTRHWEGWAPWLLLSLLDLNELLQSRVWNLAFQQDAKGAECDSLEGLGS